MDENTKKSFIINIIVRAVILCAVFLVTFFVSTGIMNSNNEGATSEMKDCTFPTITTVYKGRAMNRMYGYAQSMDMATIRSGVSLLDETNKLPVQIQTYGTEVTQIQYQVRSMDASRLIEETTVKDYTQSENQIDVRLELQDLLEAGKDYQLIIQLSTKANDKIYYYARIRKDGEFYAQENLDFVLDFHEKTRSKSSGEEIVKYLESNNQDTNSSFNKVNIHSNYQMVTWGDLQLLDCRDMDITLSEINNQTATINLSYMAVLGNGANEEEHYNVTEYYRVRYTKDRMYLLDFERTMDQMFEMDNQVIYSTAVQLGIRDADVEYQETEDGRSVSFVQEGELFAYNSSEHTMAKIFGFWNKDTDVRYRNQQHDIKIINVDEQGNTDFVVYGYMNRGVHEGKVGVSVCHYDSSTNSTQEYAFLNTNRSYEVLKTEVGRMLYLNHNGDFFISLQKNLYVINMDTRKVRVLLEDADSDAFAVAQDNTLLVLQKEAATESKELTYINLDTGKEKKISCGDDERIRPIGFIGRDFIYGIAKAADVLVDANGQLIFPMYKLVIEDSEGKVKKNYEIPDVFVMSYTIEDHVLHLGRVVRSGAGFVQTDDDQIIHSLAKNDRNITVKVITTDLKKKECQLEFGFSLSKSKKKCLQPKEVLLENAKDIKLENGRISSGYYVYTKGKLENLYTSASSAVQKADEEAGVVVTVKQDYVWERTKRQNQKQIDSLETVSTASGYTSLQACLLSLMHFGGSGEDPRTLLEQGMSVTDILKTTFGEDKVVNLTGCSLDQVLYCIDRGYPILAALASGEYVVLCGYNELNTIVMDPVKAKTGYVGMNDSRAMFAAGGNSFIVCIPE